MDSESDLEESNVYLITLNPKTADWDEISETDSVIDQSYPNRDQRLSIIKFYDFIWTFRNIIKKDIEDVFNIRNRNQSISSCSTYDVTILKKFYLS